MRRKYSSVSDRLPVEERRELADERADEIERLDLELVAGGVDVFAQLRADDGEDNERAVARRRLEDRSHGLARTHARVQLHVPPRVGKLEQRGAHDFLGRIARRVAEDVDAPRLHRCSRKSLIIP
jgi:hypothetical protein